MKKILLLCVFGLACSGARAQSFSEGDIQVGLTIGAGTVAYDDKSRGTFDQHLTVDYGVTSFADDRLTLSIGGALNNAYGGSFDTPLFGTYDYTFKKTEITHSWNSSTNSWADPRNESKKERRKGNGTAEGRASREDVSLLFTVGLHLAAADKLDVYAQVGAGFGFMNHVFGKYDNLVGFEEADVDTEKTTPGESKVRTSYKFDDLSHVKWQGYKTKFVPSLAAYVGVTYYFTEHFGATTQLGLIGSNLHLSKNGYADSYSIWSIGAVFKF